jgi:O-antigen ligase
MSSRRKTRSSSSALLSFSRFEMQSDGAQFDRINAVRRRWFAAGAIGLLTWLTFGFAGVYPLIWQPFVLAAVVVGVFGMLYGHALSPGVRIVGFAWIAIVATIVIQVVPLSSSWLDLVSPNARRLIAARSIEAATLGVNRHPISIEPQLTIKALVFAVSFGVFGLGFARIVNRASLFLIARWILIVGSLLAVTGILQRAWPHAPLYGFWVPYAGLSNAFGPFVNRNHFAGWMIMATGLGLGFLQALYKEVPQSALSNWRNRIIWTASESGSRIILTSLAITLMSISTMWTLSRSGILALSFVYVLFVLAVSRDRSANTRRRVNASLLALSILCIAIGWRGAEVLSNRFAMSESLISRLQAWDYTLRVIEDFPVLGTGVNTFTIATMFYQTNLTESHFAESHNDYLQVISDGGTVMGLIVLVTIVMLALAVRRRIGDTSDAQLNWLQTGAALGLMGIALQETVDFSLQKPANAMLFTIVLLTGLYDPSAVVRTSASKPLIKQDSIQ